MFETIPSSRSARWALLQNFIDRWYPPVMMNDGYPEAEIIAAERRLQLKLPTALTEWYLFFGNRYDLWQTQDSLCPPSQLCLDEDGLRFYYENQGCFHWSIPTANLDDDDPPVSINFGGDLMQVNSSVSEHAIQRLLYETKFHYFGGGTTDDSKVVRSNVIRAVEENYSRCALPDWPIFSANIRFFEAPDVFIEIWSFKNKPDWLEFWFCTRNKHLCRELTIFFQNCGLVFDTIIDDEIFIPTANYFSKKYEYRLDSYSYEIWLKFDCA